LAAGADAERGEHLPQVVGDGRRADVQLRGDLGVRDTLSGQPGDVRFPRGEGILRMRGAFGGARSPVARSSIRVRSANAPASAATKISYAARS